MNTKNDRYKNYNMHIINPCESTQEYAILYDVPTNSLYKLSSELGKQIELLQKNDSNSNVFKNIELYFEKKFDTKETTIPSHSFWGETKVISKLTINVTSRCNLKCKYCFAEFGSYGNYSQCDMHPFEAIEYISKLVVQANVKEIKMIQFFGGEPLLAISTIKAICEYFEYLFNNGKIGSIPKYTMITNLVNCNSNIFYIIQKYNISLTVSIDGPKEIHDLQRCFSDGTGTFDYIKRNVTVLHQHVKAIEVTYTKNHIDNKMSICDVRKYLSNYFKVEIEKIFVVQVINTPSLDIDLEKYHTYIEDEMLDIDDRQAIVACDPMLQSDLLCTTGYHSICIMPNGDLYPCHIYAKDKTFCLGNLKEKCDVSEIKHNLYEKLSINNKKSHECMTCWARKICHICPASIMVLSNNRVLTSKSICDSRRKIYEKILLKSIE